jgi:glycosyltransferase involved in cell wall biosynthesis
VTAPQPKLVFLCSELTVGGFQRHLAQLAPGLVARGFETEVIALREEGRFADELRAQGVPTSTAGLRSRIDVIGMRRAVRLAAREPRIVVTQSVDAHLVGAATARRTGSLHVALEHGGQERLRAMPLHHRLAYRRFAPRVDHAVSISTSQVSAMVEVGYTAQRISVIPNGVPEQVVGRSRAETRADLGFGDNDFVVGLVATLRPEKRVGLFIEAVLAAAAQEPTIRGFVAGAGPDLELVRRRAASSDGVVVALGERSDVPDLIAAADLVVLTSSAECLPLVILEAMAAARPVVATDVGGVSELIRSGETGIVVAADDFGELVAAIVGLGCDHGRAVSLGRAARESYERDFTADKMIGRYASLFAELG